jgi:hypothetical protein
MVSNTVVRVERIRELFKQHIDLNLASDLRKECYLSQIFLFKFIGTKFIDTAASYPMNSTISQNFSYQLQELVNINLDENPIQLLRRIF